ncbi:MAG: hypothetical protein V2B19_14610, partial [Pseudomonadota bacterium]
DGFRINGCMKCENNIIVYDKDTFVVFVCCHDLILRDIGPSGLWFIGCRFFADWRRYRNLYRFG